MTIEKMASRARVILMSLSVIGVLMTGASVVFLIITLRLSLADPQPNWIMTAVTGGVMGVLVCLSLLIALLPWILWPITMWLGRNAKDHLWRYDQIMGAIESNRQMLEMIREASSLSDAAKEVAYRAKDLQALRDAIQEEMEKQDFEAALVLAENMDSRFGYHQEAAQLREQIRQTASDVYERQVQEIVDNIDQKLARHEWVGAMEEAARVNKFYSDHPSISQLPERIQAARDEHKRNLLQLWKEAVARDDVDQSVSLLKQLDQYLSPSEAEAYKDSARDVFRKRLQQLGSQFAVHVHDKNWAEALKVGQQIVAEFPNTRMAAEVRDRLPVLSERAQPMTVPTAS